jgi:PAS domain S-box-containing protein
MNELDIEVQGSPSVGQRIAKTEDLAAIVETYRALFEASNTGAWEYFTDTRNLNCNEVYFGLLGRKLDDFDFSGKPNLKETWIDLLHPDDVALSQKRFARYLKNPTDKMYESFFRMKHADGEWKWIWSRGKFMTDALGNNTNRVIGTHIDVTSYKKAEDDVKEEQMLLRTLIDSLPQTIYIKDSQARKVIANRADVISIGLNAEADVVGKTDVELFEGEIGLRGYNDDMEILQTGKAIVNKEEFFFDKEGNKNWLVTTKVPLRDEAGNVNRILGIGHNITERKESEEALNKLNAELNQQSQELSKQAEDLKALNEQLKLQKEQELEKAIAQGKFEIASEVLHDIGNALVGFGSYLNRINRVLDASNVDTIKSLSGFIKMQQVAIAGAIGTDKASALAAITEGIVKTQVENKDEIGNSVNELLNIISHIQEILNIQRQFVRGHGGVHERKPVSLVNLIDDCKAMLFASFDKKGIQLKTHIKPGNYVIKGDHTKLMQVILNILKNSVEAIDFDAEEKRITIAMEANDEVIELRVADNGQGFDQETGKRFFERGFTTKKSGTGLGLYNCRSIVESHAGSFDITSNGPGQGAETVIRFSVL